MTESGGVEKVKISTHHEISLRIVSCFATFARQTYLITVHAVNSLGKGVNSSVVCEGPTISMYNYNTTDHNKSSNSVQVFYSQLDPSLSTPTPSNMEQLPKENTIGSKLEN